MLSKPASKTFFFFFLFFSLGCKTECFGQNPTEADVKSALILNFLRYITPVGRLSSDTIIFGVYGDESVMKQSLKKIDRQKVRGKVVKLTGFNLNSDCSKFDVIYILPENNNEVWWVFKTIKRTHTLLITDGYGDKKEIMVNFISNENKIRFEINSKNIQDAQMVVSSKLLLLGGTDVDIRELYNATEKSLSDEKEKSDQYEHELESKKSEIVYMNKQLNDLYVRIDSLNSIILFQIYNIHKQNANLDSVRNEVSFFSRMAGNNQNIIKSSCQKYCIKGSMTSRQCSCACAA